MRKAAIGLAGVLAATGCGVGGTPVSPPDTSKLTVSQTQTQKPTLGDLKGQIPDDLSPEEATQVVSPQEGEDDAAPPEGVEADDEDAGDDRTVQQRRGGGFRHGGFRGGGFRAGGFRHGGFGRFRGHHNIFFPRHRAFFRHRFFGHGRWWRPFWRSGALFYPIVYSGVPYYVQYCWSPALGRFTPCEIVAAVI